MITKRHLKYVMNKYIIKIFDDDFIKEMKQKYPKIEISYINTINTFNINNCKYSFIKEIFHPQKFDIWADINEYLNRKK